MSVKRLVASADVSLLNVSRFCAEHGIGRTTFYELRRRFEAEGEAGLGPRSRAPKTVANKTPIEVEELIVKLRKELDDDGLDAGAETIWWHLQQQLHRPDKVPTASTIWRILRARGFIVDDLSKRPSKVWKRFAAERANELSQIDGTDYELESGQIVKIINIIDDGSRYCPASQAHVRRDREADDGTAAFEDAGMPARFLSDNGKAFRKLDATLASIGVSMGHSSIYHPQTCGKVERFHQTQAKWLAARPQASTLAELQTLLDRFRHIYNHDRPHRGIGRNTPATQWQSMPKTGPADRPLNLEIATTTHFSKVAPNGAVHASSYRISLGAKHAGQMAWTIITGTRADVFIKVGAVVLRSDDPDFFIAHFDVSLISTFPFETPAVKDPELGGFHLMCETYRTMPKATIAEIAGRVGGGGKELAMSCDMRFGAIGKTIINQMEVPLGILPGGTGTQRLPRLVGRGRAMEIILGGVDIDKLAE